MSRPRAFLLVAVLLALGVAAATAEVAVRVLAPAPRIQVVRLDEPWLRLEERDGVPLWWDPIYADAPIRGPDCAAGQPVVGVAGDSVLMTVDPDGQHHRVADELREALGVCVRDGSWAGYRPYQEAAMLRWIDAQTPLSVAVISVWKDDRRYHRLGDALFDSEMVAHDPADGLPRSPLPGLPTALHRGLFLRSRAWAYLTLAASTPVPGPRDPAQAYLDVIAWAAARHVQLVVVEAASLKSTLADAAAARRAWPDDDWRKRIEVATRAAGFEHVVLADALAGEDAAAIRLDTCCHYNRAGHAAVARALRPHVEAALARAAAGR